MHTGWNGRNLAPLGRHDFARRFWTAPVLWRFSDANSHVAGIVLAFLGPNDPAAYFQSIPTRIIEEDAIVGRGVYRTEHRSFDISRASRNRDLPDLLHLLLRLRPKGDARCIRPVLEVFN